MGAGATRARGSPEAVSPPAGQKNRGRGGRGISHAVQLNSGRASSGKLQTNNAAEPEAQAAEDLLGPATKAYLAVLRQPVLGFVPGEVTSATGREGGSATPQHQEGSAIEDANTAGPGNGGEVCKKLKGGSGEGSVSDVGGQASENGQIFGSLSPLQMQPAEVEPEQAVAFEPQSVVVTRMKEVSERERADFGAEQMLERRELEALSEQHSSVPAGRMGSSQEQSAGDNCAKIEVGTVLPVIERNEVLVTELDEDEGEGETTERRGVYQEAARCRPAEVYVGDLCVPISPNVTQRKRHSTTKKPSTLNNTSRKRPQNYDICIEDPAEEESRAVKTGRYELRYPSVDHDVKERHGGYAARYELRYPSADHDVKERHGGHAGGEHSSA